MKNYFIIFFTFTLTPLLLISCNLVNTPAIIENNQFLYYGKNEKYSFVKIQTNKSVSKLSQEYHVPIKEIKRLNSLTSYNDIKQGTILKIPVGKFYLIKSDDTLESIAKIYNVNLDLLAKQNGVSIDSEIYAGDYIKIPEFTNQCIEKNHFQHIKFDSSDIKNNGDKKKFQEDQIHTRKNKEKNDKLNILTNKEKTITIVKSLNINNAFNNKYPINSKDFEWPVNGKIIKKYGEHNGRFNEGINISVAKGTTVKAASRGKVVYNGYQEKHGNLIILNHNNGYMTAYSHLDKSLINKGQIVNKGAQIGIVGNSGNVDKPQLQFSMKKDAGTINPDE